MRSLIRFSFPLLALFVLVFSSGCGDDTPGGGGVTLPPIVTLDIGDDFVSGDQDLDLTTPSFRIRVTGNDGDAPLRSLAITENGVNIPASRLNFLTGQVSNNPILIAGDDVNGFTYDIDIIGNPGIAGDATYAVTLTDSDNESDTESFTINYIEVGPNIEFLIQDGFVSGDATVETRGGLFNVRVQTSSTGADLQSLAVLEDGNLIDASQIRINDGNVESMNPLTFATGEMSGMPTYRFQISPNVDEDVTRTYTFRATDVNGVSTEESITITFMPPPGTAIQFDTMGVFFNASGRQLGGLDLDNAEAVAFNSDEAEIQDEGINLNATPGTENWRAQISGANDADVRMANFQSLGEGIDFNTITTQEEIQTAFEEGFELDGEDNFPDADGDLSNDEEVTQPLIGPGPDNRPREVLAVFRNGRYYLVRIDDVNCVANSNEDNYDVSIKY